MVTSYHLRISYCVCGVTSVCFNTSVRIVLVSVTGMLEYRFVMSKEAREWGVIKVVYQVLGVFFHVEVVG